MSISIDDFSDPAFDVKAWVNRAAAGYVDERPRAFDSALFSPLRRPNADRSPLLPPPHVSAGVRPRTRSTSRSTSPWWR